MRSKHLTNRKGKQNLYFCTVLSSSKSSIMLHFCFEVAKGEISKTQTYLSPYRGKSRPCGALCCCSPTTGLGCTGRGVALAEHTLGVDEAAWGQSQLLLAKALLPLDPTTFADGGASHTARPRRKRGEPLASAQAVGTGRLPMTTTRHRCVDTGQRPRRKGTQPTCTVASSSLPTGPLPRLRT